MTVEQLRAELANLREEKAGLISLAEHEAREVNRLRAENERLRDENERLREALVDATEFAHGLSFSKKKLIADWSIRVASICRAAMAKDALK